MTSVPGWKIATSAIVLIAVIAGSTLVLGVFEEKNTVTVDISGSGAVSGAGEYRDGSEVTLTAQPSPGYVFEGWYAGGRLLSTACDYSFISSDSLSVTARFVLDQFTVNLTQDDYGGTVNGGGIYTYKTKATVYATTYNGYVFDGWYDGGNLLSTSSTYTFTVDRDYDITAKFSVKSYNVSVSSNYDGGTISGAGSYPYLSTATLTVDENYGYNFDGWYDTDTDAMLSSESCYSFTVTDDTDIKARFSLEVFKIDTKMNYDGGAVTISGTFQYTTYVLCYASVDSGYMFEGWSIDGTIVSSSTSYNHYVDGDATITAIYSIVHDASFGTSLSSSTAPTWLTVSPTYNVEITQRTITVTDTLSGTELYKSTDNANTYSYYIDDYAALNVTQTIIYSDGYMDSYSDIVVVDDLVSYQYTWKYQEDEWYSILTSWFLNNKTGAVNMDLSFAWYYGYLSDDIPRGYTAAKARLNDYVSYEDPTIVSLAAQLNKITSDMTELQRLNCVLKFVQSFEYEYDIDGKGVVEYYKYPAETLWEMKGDCEDHAILFASLVKAMGYDVVLYHVKTSDGYHLAAGVAVNGGSGYSTVYDGKTYYYCEATASSGGSSYNWANVGYIPDGYSILTTYPID